MDEPHINIMKSQSEKGKDNTNTWTSTEVDFVIEISREFGCYLTREEVFAEPKFRWHIEVSRKAELSKRDYRTRDEYSRLCATTFRGWVVKGTLISMLSFIWESYTRCTWLELRRLLSYTLIEATKTAEFDNELSTTLRRDENAFLDKMLLDVDPGICTAAIQYYLQNGPSSSDIPTLTTFGQLVTQHKSKRVRYCACTALGTMIDTAELGRPLALILGSKLLEISKADPSVYSRAAAMKAVKRLYLSDAFPLNIEDVARLVSADDHPIVLRHWAQLVWSTLALGIPQENESNFLERMLKVVHLVKSGALSEPQGAILMAHQKTCWQYCCRVFRDGSVDNSTFHSALSLLVAWVERVTEAKKMSRRGIIENEKLTEISSVLGLVDELQSEDTMTYGVRLLCHVMLQGHHKELPAVEKALARVMDVFTSTSTHALINVIGDFFQFLYEDPYYNAWIKAKLEVVAAITLSSKDEHYTHRFAALCGTVLKPSQELGQMEPEAISRYIQKQVEVDIHIDHETAFFLKRIVQLCPKFPQKSVLILKTVGKYTSRAKIHSWPLPELTEEFSSWLVQNLEKFTELDTIALVECILGLWYYNVASEELVVNIQRLLPEQKWALREIELIEPS